MREIADYEAAEDDYFRARASDLADLRDRVLAALAGDSDAAIAAGQHRWSPRICRPRASWPPTGAGGGVVLARGSATSHVAMLARSRGVPMVVGVGARSMLTGSARRCSTATTG